MRLKHVLIVITAVALIFTVRLVFGIGDRRPLTRSRQYAARNLETSQIHVVAGPGASDDDREAVEDALVNIPSPVADQISRAHITVVACRERVTNCFPALHNVHPDGWPEGSTWDLVPGAFVPASNAVAISTIEGPQNTRVVMPARPPDPNGVYAAHGSSSLAVHELLHGFDAADSFPSNDPSLFLPALKRDCDSLNREYNRTYFTNMTWGPREAFAESGARHFGNQDTSFSSWPSLASYWDTFISEFTSRKRTLNFAQSIRSLPFDPKHDIGIASIQKGGDIEMSLIAHNHDGTSGEALISIGSNNPRYKEIREKILSRDLVTQPSLCPQGADKAFRVQPFVP